MRTTEVVRVNDVLNRVLDIVTQQLGMAYRGNEATVLADMGADELDLEEIQSELQIEFNLNIHQDLVNACRTVGDIVTLIKEKMK